jgi:hypothetical protein
LTEVAVEPIVKGRDGDFSLRGNRPFAVKNEMGGGDNGLGRGCPRVAFKGFGGDSHSEAQLTILPFIPRGDDTEAVLNRFVCIIAFVNDLPQGGGKDKAKRKEKDFFRHLNHPSICYWKKEAVANELIIVMRRRSQGCQSPPLSLRGFP